MLIRHLFFPLVVLWLGLGLLATAVYSLQAAASPADVTDLRLNEFLASNQSNLEDPDEPGTFPDWIEIYNAGATAVNLNGLYLTDNLGQLNQYLIPADIIVPPQGYVLFYADSQPLQGAAHTNFALGAGGEEIALVASDGSTILDSYTFGPQAADISAGRFPDGANNWQFFNPPSPGAANAQPPFIDNLVQTPLHPGGSDTVTISAQITDNGTVVAATLYYSATHTTFTAVPMAALGGSQYQATIPPFANGTAVDYYLHATDNDGLPSSSPPGAPANTHRYIVGFTPPPLFINEFMALNTTLVDPTEPGDFPDWIEIYNAGSIPIDLASYYLTDSLNNLAQSLVSGSLIVPAHGFVLFYADATPSQGPNHTNFRLSSTNGEDVALVGPDGQTIIDSYTFAPQTANTSEGRLLDGADNWVFFNPATPGASNTLALQISATQHQPPFPAASDAVLVTTTIVGGSSITATLVYSITGSAQALPLTAVGSNQYQATIPAQPEGTAVHYYVTASNEWGVTSTDPADAPANSYLYIVGYTPPELFVNEFLASNNTNLEDPTEPGDFPDWIEIYNPTAAAVDLNGYYLSDNPANLTQSLIAGSVVLEPGGFALFFADAQPEQGANHTHFRLSGAGESILLVAPDGQTIIDSYTFGPQTADVSAGRLPDGGPDWVFFNVPTPGSSNAFFPPQISATTYTPPTPGASDSVNVQTTIMDDGTIVGATLFYRTTGSFSAVGLTAVGNSQYQATIPPFPVDTQVQFYVTAQDNDGLISSDPPTAPSTTYSYVVGFVPPPLTINEFMASNTVSLEDPDEPGDYPDWIEIYNAGGTAVDLSGLYLSDDPALLTKYQIPAGLSVPAGGYLLFYADDTPAQGPQHANFRLGAAGESIWLVATNGVVIIDSYTFGSQTTDISEGRCPDGGSVWQFQTIPTPGTTNDCRVDNSYNLYLPVIRQ